MAKPKDNPNYKVIADNRRARFDYAIEDDLEVGIVPQRALRFLERHPAQGHDVGPHRDVLQP